MGEEMGGGPRGNREWLKDKYQVRVSMESHGLAWKFKG